MRGATDRGHSDRDDRKHGDEAGDRAAKTSTAHENDHGADILAIFAGWRYADTHSLPGGRGCHSARRQVYVMQCAACHGAGLEGQPEWRTQLPSGRLPAPPHDESGHTWHYPDEVLFRIVKEGTCHHRRRGIRERYAGLRRCALSDVEIRAVLDYIKSAWPERERSYQEKLSQADH